MSERRYGSLTNLLTSRSINGRPEPEVGMGATMLLWSDRSAGTIVGVTLGKSGPNVGKVVEVKWQQDTVTVNKDSDAWRRGYGPGNSEFYDYLYEPNPQARIQTFTLRAGGEFREKGSGSGSTLHVGVRDEYRDPTF